MNRTTYVVDGPTQEPLTLDEVKDHCRIDADNDADDAKLISFIQAARVWCEDFTQRSLVPQTRAAVFDAWPIVIELLYGPVTSVTSITYVDTAGVTQTLASSKYQVDLKQPRARIVPAYGEEWPTLRTETLNPVTVTYEAGESVCPFPVQMAMKLLIGHWYENHEGSIVGTIVAETPFGIEAMLRPWSLKYFA